MSLKDILIERIRTVGPMRVSDYMAECLMHPQQGYYATRDPLGARGDFTTAPEMTQMFGELLGLSLAQAWMDQGAPDSFVLAEIGPGRGTLMADLLRATNQVPGFHDALDLHLVEASPTLRTKQRELLGEATWHDAVADLPKGPLFLVANEFFDALPVRQFIREGDLWRERLVGFENAQLCFGMGAPADQPLLRHRLEDTEEGHLVEICEAAHLVAHDIGARIKRHGGAALIIDYGDWRSLGDTMQAVKGHEEVDVLDLPGDSDLTAHVDFELLCAATPSRFSRVTPQGVFLERLGITTRAQVLAQQMEPVQIEQHVAAHRRLTHPEEMGNLFKVVAFYPDGESPPPGLDP